VTLELIHGDYEQAAQLIQPRKYRKACFVYVREHLNLNVKSF